MKEKTQVKSITLWRTLEKKDEEIKKLAGHIAIQEAQLQQLLCSDVLQITDEHQLQKCIELLHNLEDSRNHLVDAEEERRIIATEATLLQLLQNEASYNKKHTYTEPNTVSCTYLMLVVRNMHKPECTVQRSLLPHLVYHIPIEYFDQYGHIGLAVVYPTYLMSQFLMVIRKFVHVYATVLQDSLPIQAFVIPLSSSALPQMEYKEECSTENVQRSCSRPW